MTGKKTDISKLRVEAPGGTKRVLLHACCAPCSSAIVECMKMNGLEPVIYYSNPNIYPLEEYEHRRSECARYAEKWGLQMVEDPYDHEAWLRAVKGLEQEPERGGRCLQCFRYRLLRAARYAAAHGYAALTTTLASSRWKRLDQVDDAGSWACSQVEGVTWWAQNWRKGGLQERRNEIIREMDFYNQLYCGCEFSFRPDSRATL
ncbi:MAG: epoxyqueuosine reductase QueH [Bacteroidales bacterium]|nr:epoxyqueuosine reductase QueH [Bacteroidales bacterium]